MRCLICEKEQSVKLSIELLFSWRSLSDSVMCENCHLHFIEINKQEACSICLKKGKAPLCLDCKDWFNRDDLGMIQHHALFEYNKSMQEWFKKYKFIGDVRLAKCFKSELQNALKKYDGWIITVIPLGKERLQERGFNQVAELLDVAGISYVEVFDKKEGIWSSQSSKTREERLSGKQPFCLRDDTKLGDTRILIVDDVYTTGRTLRYACELLKGKDVDGIETFSLAR